jgi:hypothetical protein
MDARIKSGHDVNWIDPIQSKQETIKRSNPERSEKSGLLRHSRASQ